MHREFLCPSKPSLEIIAILLSPLLIAGMGTNNALRISAGLAILSFIVLANISSISGMVFGAALEGLYYGMFAAIGLTYVQEFAEGRIARATSLYMNALYTGGLIAGPLMGLIAQYTSFASSILLSIVWAVAALVALTIIDNRVRRQNPH